MERKAQLNWIELFSTSLEVSFQILTFIVFYLFIENSHFRHHFENLRRSEQASIGNRFSCKYPQGQLSQKHDSACLSVGIQFST